MNGVSPKDQLRRAVQQLEWGANIRIEKAWQIDMIRQIIAGEKKEGVAEPPTKFRLPNPATPH